MVLKLKKIAFGILFEKNCLCFDYVCVCFSTYIIYVLKWWELIFYLLCRKYLVNTQTLNVVQIMSAVSFLVGTVYTCQLYNLSDFELVKMRTHFYTFNKEKKVCELSSIISQALVCTQHCTLHFMYFIQTFCSFAFLSCHLRLSVLCRCVTEWLVCSWDPFQKGDGKCYEKILAEITQLYKILLYLRISYTFSGLVKSASWRPCIAYGNSNYNRIF